MSILDLFRPKPTKSAAPKAYFIGRTQRRARYWAEQWGYGPYSAKVVTTPSSLRGVGNDFTFYLTDETLDRDMEEMISYLRSKGATLIHAEDLQ